MGKDDAVVFLSYRRGDTQWAARGIHGRLSSEYGQDRVFRDLDGIPPGVRFRDYVHDAISKSDIFVLLIGRAWASMVDDEGRRRLELPRDPLRVEIETALEAGLPIIPVRVEGAPMPTERDLPPSILELLEFNATEISDSRWDFDIARLVEAIDHLAADRREVVEPTVAPARPVPVRIEVQDGLGAFLGVAPVAVTRLADRMPDVDPSFLRDYQSARRTSQRSYFLTHVLGPATQPGQKYSVTIKVTPHRDATDEIRSTSFYLGRSWGNRVLPGERGPSGRHGIVTEAYGPFIALCEVEFTDGDRIPVDHYCDFDMGSLLPSSRR